MAVLFSSRKLCPTCGKPLAAVPDDVAVERQRYVCTHCDTDPMHDPAARRWADSPLRPPAK
ncbi:zinc ribbon domain-containing protein [Bradyrhizobium sp. CB2312]|uniref:zinc ribbon domain-containing protein n=1 Tax=Bradyrhizobium sp. CB2312 TaxID=3039155 RepID=UPI0024B13098|nr:zinc ribbon domain-containing protein [Bradyrhizobium sp. CB2312]WFU75474.1 zinc ribbon domain-containing protein [Bradyrhizobium sp. CB2312]